jgi:DNA repair protein RecO (recombination protein O)
VLPEESLPERKVAALILRRIVYSDTSLVIHCYSAELGRSAVIAKGVRRKGSRLDPVLQTGYLVELLFNEKENRDLHVLKDADLLNNFPGTRDGYDRILSSVAICEIIERSQFRSQQDPLMFETAIHCLELIAENCPYPVNHVYWFLLYTLAHAGYYLDMSRCADCGADVDGFRRVEGASLDKRNGALYCPDCTQGHDVLAIEARIVRVLLFLSSGERNEIGVREITSATRKVLGDFLNRLYHIHLEHWNGINSLEELAEA